MAIYTVLTLTANTMVLWMAKRKLLPAAVADDWQPQHMMYFTCKVRMVTPAMVAFVATVVSTQDTGNVMQCRQQWQMTGSHST
jgi:hypothetical protein